MVRRVPSSGMSPSAIWSSIAGSSCASSRSLRRVRTGRARAVAMACSVHSAETRASMARHWSTGPIWARTTFSDIARRASPPSSGPRTSTRISAHPAAMAAATRRCPATISRSSPSSRTTGGCRMPTARMLATICASGCSPADMRRGLFGLTFRVRGSTGLRCMVLCSLSGSAVPFSRTIPPAAASRSCRHHCGRAPLPCAACGPLGGCARRGAGVAQAAMERSGVGRTAMRAHSRLFLSIPSHFRFRPSPVTGRPAVTSLKRSFTVVASIGDRARSSRCRRQERAHPHPAPGPDV